MEKTSPTVLEKHPASMLRTRAINRKLEKLGTGSVVEKKK